MDIEKLIFAILFSLIALLGISMIAILIVFCMTYFMSIGTYSGLIGIILVLILFVCLVSYFYKSIE